MVHNLLDDGRNASAQDLEEYCYVKTPTISQKRGTRRITNVTALRSNYELIRANTGKEVIAVVKARSYGAGLVPTSEALHHAGCRAFAVATLGAGIALREEFEKKELKDAVILVFGYISPGALALAKQHALTVTVTDAKIWESYESELKTMNLKPEDPSVCFQINVDTGMTRIGIQAWHEDSESLDKVVAVARKVHTCEFARLTGIYTHFPLANEREFQPNTKPYHVSEGQTKTLESIVKRLQNERLPTGMVHLANSGAIERFRFAFNQEWITHVRPGSLLYGMSVNDGTRYKRVTRWVTSLVRVETTLRDVGVGYGHIYHAQKGDTIGTLPVGYGDGYFNTSSPDVQNIVRIDGILLNVIGKVAMDMCMIDLNPYVETKNRVPKPEDNLEVELVSDGLADDELSPEKVSARWGSSWYMMLTGIRTRNELTYSNESSTSDQAE